MPERALPNEQPNLPIIVAVDGSASSRQAVVWATAAAARHGCPLRIVTSIVVPAAVLGLGLVFTDSDRDDLHRDGERVVEHALRLACGAALAITTEVTSDPVIPYLIAASRHARTVVVGSRGLGAVRRGLLGSVSTAVAQHAHCPVTVIHGSADADARSVLRPVLVGMDGIPGNESVLELAFEQAALRKVGLTALHCGSDGAGPYMSAAGWESLLEQTDDRLTETLAGVSARYPDVEVRRIQLMADPTRALLEESRNAQLLVVGNRGRGGLTGMLLGSTSSALLHSAACPTMIVRSVHADASHVRQRIAE